MFVCNDGQVLLIWHNSPQLARASSFMRFLDHTQRRNTVGRTPLNEWSARRRDLYLTTHNSHNRQTSMAPVGFESTISAGEGPRTYGLDRTANGTGNDGQIFARNVKYLCINSMCNSLYFKYFNNLIENFVFWLQICTSVTEPVIIVYLVWRSPWRRSCWGQNM